jgi:aspartyl-tRNA(Asn)/glutamyl-tRNA(Gln) amidotransferase subunit A
MTSSWCPKCWGTVNLNNLLKLSALELKNAISRGDTTATEALEAYLHEISVQDGALRAYNEVLVDEARDQARRIDDMRKIGESPGLLAGIPIAIKNNLCTTWGRTTCSSKMLANFRAPYTATAVARIRQAGAVVLGKTNMDEFAMGSSTENSAHGASVNPWDLSRVPGGSSGGSASAVAGSLCSAALGSDTGGSIRQPAALCGIVGLKPTYGRVSRYGLVAYGSSLDQIGPMTRDVADCAAVMNVIAGHDPADATSLDRPVPDYLANLDEPIKGLRIGLPREFLSDALDPEIHRAIENAVEVYRSLGAEVKEVSLPHSRIDSGAGGELSSFAVACYYIVATAEASSNLARYDGVHYGHRTERDAADIIDLYSRSRAEGFGDEVKRRIMLGTYVLSSGYYDAYYLKALKVRRLIKNDFDEAFETCDILLCPTTPSPAFKMNEKTADPLEMYLADIYTISVNLAGVPAISIPVGLSSRNLPLGMQLIGGVFKEDVVLRAARMFEKASGICRLTPPPLGRNAE